MRKPIQTIKERLPYLDLLPFSAWTKKGGNAHPSPYRAGMSSLGYQWTIEILGTCGIFCRTSVPSRQCRRMEKSGGVLCSYETQTPLSHFKVVGVSLAYELEMAGLIQCLEFAGIDPLREKTYSP